MRVLGIQKVTRGKIMINKYDETKAMDYENGFYLTSDISRMGNIIAHYELYKKIIDLPGDVIELGVFKGGSIVQFATFRELLENEKSRKIIGFDVFGEFPKADNKADEIFREKWVKETENSFLTIDEIYSSLKYKKVENVELVKGDIVATLPKYIDQHPYLKVSLLHVDTDVHKPSKVGLELLYDRVVKNGVIIFDDYGVAGETDAVDEFLMDKDYVINKFPFSHRKPSYIIKK